MKTYSYPIPPQPNNVNICYLRDGGHEQLISNGGRFKNRLLPKEINSRQRYISEECQQTGLKASYVPLLGFLGYRLRHGPIILLPFLDDFSSHWPPRFSMVDDINSKEMRKVGIIHLPLSAENLPNKVLPFVYMYT
jgi:hypothetical protein